MQHLLTFRLPLLPGAEPGRAVPCLLGGVLPVIANAPSAPPLDAGRGCEVDRRPCDESPLPICGSREELTSATEDGLLPPSCSAGMLLLGVAKALKGVAVASPPPLLATVDAVV